MKKKKLNSYQLKQRKNQLKLNKINPPKKKVVTFDDCKTTEDVIVKLKIDNNGSKKRFMKKYKKTNDVILKDYIQLNPPSVSNNIELSSYTELPMSVIRKINNEIYKHKITTNRCWFVSNHLSLRIEDIDVVDGFYGFNMFDKTEFRDFIENDEDDFLQIFIDNHSFVFGFDLIVGRKIGDFVEMKYKTKDVDKEFCDKKTKFWGWLNIETGYYYLRHSYNRYKNIYFDISTELSDNFNQFDMIFNVCQQTSSNEIEEINSRLGGFLDGMCLTNISVDYSYTKELKPINEIYSIAM